MTQIERRFIPATEIRVAGDDAAPVIEGYAALFNSDSQDLGGFIERIAPGAFKAAIGKSDIRALFNHDANYVLGRKAAGTLDVTEDAKGLAIRNTPPDTQWARDLLVSMKRGDITQMSFAFRTEDDEWGKKDGIVYRTIKKVAELLDVSPVTYPAYTDTTVAARSLGEWAKQQPESVIVPADVDAILRYHAARLRQAMAS
jgi:HK97 family phage prohead protease